jgi:hypothetical protein
MQRHVRGLLAANVTVVLLTAYGLLLPISVAYGGFLSIFTIMPDVLTYGFAALVYPGIPAVTVSGICAAVLNALGCRSKWQSIVAGALLGYLYVVFLLSSPFWPNGFLLLSLMGVLPGALGGWIYWRIAIHGSARGPVT